MGCFFLYFSSALTYLSIGSIILAWFSRYVMDVILSVISDQSFLGAILASIVFIILGFILRRFNFIDSKGRNVLNTVIMKVAIPCMAFCAFMSDFNANEFVSNILILAIDSLFYVLFLLLGNLIFWKWGKEKRKIYAILVAVGQLTFFSMPILAATYGSESGILIPTSLMSIAFRIVTYFYSYITISGEKMTKENFGHTLKKVFVNPIMICMFLGLLIWATQNFMPQIQVGDVTYGFTRIDKTLPALYKVFQFGNNMATPLCMLTIGVTLGEAKFLDTVKNGLAWFIAALRAIVFPLMILGFCLLIQMTGLIHFSELQMAAMVIGNAAPVGAVVVVYCVNFNKEEYVASDSIFLSTLLSLIGIPLLFVLVKLSMTLSIFA